MSMVSGMGNNMQENHNKLTAQVVKTAVLASVAVFSTWIFIFVGMMLIPEIGWFITLDATINGITIYLMFNFAENTYLFLCKPLAVLCYFCFGGKHAAKQATNDKRFLATLSHVHVGNKSPTPSVISPSRTDFASKTRSTTIGAGIATPQSVSLDITNMNNLNPIANPNTTDLSNSEKL